MIHAVPLFVLLAATIVIVLLLAPLVWLVVLTDGLFVAALLAAAAGWGCWPTVWLGLGRESTGRQFCLATALGFGVISTAVLVLGVSGGLNQSTCWILLAIGGLCGLLRLAHPQLCNNLFQYDQANAKAQLLIGSVILRSLALLPLCVPLAVMLFGATLPPGLLWMGEARGYDVLEYHLQVPREYYQAGYIHFLPHNVYASFPQQVETLYLLLMHLSDGPYQAAIPSQLLHAAFGLLTVIALMAWAKPGWSRILVALVAGSVPWLAYLGCLAYVELGTLFFTAVAAGLVLDHYRSKSKLDWRAALAAGLCAGLAGGCKYTAVVLVAAALGLAWVITMRGSPRTRLARLTLFGVGTLLALSPWLIRNTAFTGNPVYPFAYQWFGGSDWSAEQDAQWSRGHRLPAEQDSPAGRIKIGVNELFGSQMFGLALWLLPAALLVFSPIRQNWLAVVWLALITTIWATCTHMPGRFVVPIIVPLAMMLGELPEISRRRWIGGILVLAALLGALLNDAKLLALLHGESTRWQRQTNTKLAWLVDEIEVFRHANPINAIVAHPDANIWLVGNAAVFYIEPRRHYTVAFNRDPWLEYAADATAEECLAWLRTRNVTHVVFCWAEIDRLRGTYGFSPIVTRSWVAGLESAGLSRIPIPPDASGREYFEVISE